MVSLLTYFSYQQNPYKVNYDVTNANSSFQTDNRAAGSHNSLHRCWSTSTAICICTLEHTKVCHVTVM